MIRLIFISLLMTLTLCSCKPSERDSKTKALKINFTQEPQNFDPRKASDLASASLQFFISEGLTKSTPAASAAPGLAEKIDVSSDGLVYTFHIRDCYWSDGTPLTAQDFETSWKSSLDPHFPCYNAFLLFPIKGARGAKMGECPLSEVAIESLNSKTLQVTLETPTPYFLEITSFCTLFPVPSHLVRQHCYENPEDYPSLGPYYISKYQQGALIQLSKNPKYWEADEVKLEQISVSLIQDAMTAYRMYEKGELDLIGTPFTAIPTDIVDELSKDHTLHSQAIAGTQILSLNTLSPPLNNVNFRKALFHACNREQIIRGACRQQEIPAASLVPPILGGLDIKAPSSQPMLARAYLDIALMEMDTTVDKIAPLHLCYAAPGANDKIAIILQEQIKQTLNIDLILEPSDAKVLIDKLTKQNYDIGLCVCYAQYFDSMNLLERFAEVQSPKNFTGWSSNRYNKLLSDSMHIADPNERQLFLHNAEEIITAEVPLIPLFHPSATFMVQSHVKNIYKLPTGGLCFNQITFEPERKGNR